MAGKVLRLAELRQLDESARSQRISEFAATPGPTLNGEVADLDRRIAEYETRYEMASGTMKERFHAGGLKETADISHWLILLQLRERIAAKTS